MTTRPRLDFICRAVSADTNDRHGTKQSSFVEVLRVAISWVGVGGLSVFYTGDVPLRSVCVFVTA